MNWFHTIPSEPLSAAGSARYRAVWGASLLPLAVTRAVCVLTLLVMAGFAQASDLQREPLNVVVTTGMVADVAKGVGGDLVSVTTLMNAGVDPHLYKLTRRDLSRLMSADLVLYSGLKLEGKMDAIIARLKKQNRPVLAVAESIPAERLMSSGDYAGQYDPHIWMDVERWYETIPAVTQALTDLLPEQANRLSSNAEQYGEQLQLLHKRAIDSVKSIPANNRVLVTAHDAFGYFGEAYGVEVIGVQGVSTESEAGLKRIEMLVNLLVERQIPTVFVESSVSRRNVDALIAGAAAQGHQVSIGGSLFSDATGPAGTWESTYRGMLEHNINTIASALGGSPMPDTLNPATLHSDQSNLVMENN